jgi:hypothetical protein
MGRNVITTRESFQLCEFFRIKNNGKKCNNNKRQKRNETKNDRAVKKMGG